jgi:uncharacterized protein YneF (UPF0154 family)
MIPAIILALVLLVISFLLGLAIGFSGGYELATQDLKPKKKCQNTKQ